jgi:hypothetical protein
MNNKVKAQVVGAYFEPTRNLNFKASSPVPIKDAVSIMATALEVKPNQCGYNEFRPNFLNKLPKGSKVTLAREGSVCVYVTLPKDAKFFEDDARATMKVDEFHLQADGTLRLWWD